MNAGLKEQPIEGIPLPPRIAFMFGAANTVAAMVVFISPSLIPLAEKFHKELWAEIAKWRPGITEDQWELDPKQLMLIPKPPVAPTGAPPMPRSVH